MAQVSNRFDDLGADGKPVRLGLMGGTFDPIHIGHLRVAEEMREELSLDAVLFIPAGNPVFKRDQNVTDAEVRFAQVAAAVAGNPHFDASRIEIDREGGTYTVETLRQLREHYPENVQFYLILGSDAAASIGKWRGCAEIAALAARGTESFYCGGALGFDTIAARAVLAARDKYPFVRLVLALPCPQQDALWSRADRDEYRAILSAATTPS